MMRSIRAVQTVFTPSRALEWHCALSSALLSVILAFPGSTFSTSMVYSQFEEVMPEEGWGAAIGLVAGIRIVALLINGHWLRTPLLRAGTAALGAGLWAYIATLFWMPDQPLTFGLAFTFVLAGSEILSATRAGRDMEVAKSVWSMMQAAPPAELPRGFAP